MKLYFEKQIAYVKPFNMELYLENLGKYTDTTSEKSLLKIESYKPYEGQRRFQILVNYDSEKVSRIVNVWESEIDSLADKYEFVMMSHDIPVMREKYDF